MNANNDLENIAVCKNCGSENVYFSKKQQCYVCEDCESKFTLENDKKSLRIFLSYGHDESAFVVEEIRKMLLAKGHNPWVDKFKIKGGSNWRSQITHGILESDDFLAFITNHSIRKPGVCLDEIAIALGTRNCRIQSVLLEKDATVPSSISTKQWTDLSEWKQIYQQGEEVWKSWLTQMTDEIVKAIDNPSNAKKSIQISQVKKAIHPITPDIKLKQLLNGNILSRKWLFQKVLDWYETDSKCLLLMGSPGAGKSVLCAQLSHYMAQCAGLYFLEWNNVESRKLKNIFSSIIFQLCCNIDDFRERIVEKLSDFNETVSEDFLLNQMLLEPLNMLIDGDREKRFVIIDAIDEFEEDERNTAFPRLKKLIDSSPRWLRWIVTSRPISDALPYYFNAKTIKIDEHKEDIRKDIRAFCKGYLEDRGNTNKVVAKSSGSFVYAKELVEAINHQVIGSSDLEQLPATLSAIFMTNLHRILGGKKYAAYKPLISLLLVAQEPVETKTARKILNIEEEKLNELIAHLKSFINVETTPKGEQKISIYHKSFSDWFFSPESSTYRISKEEAHRIFANYVVHNVDEIENEEYLAKYAYTHLRNAKEWVNLDYQQKKKLLYLCIFASDRFGNISYQEQYLNIYQEELDEDIPFLIAKVSYLQGIGGKDLEIYAEKLLALSHDCMDEKTRFEAKLKASIGFFYAGKDIASRELLLSMRSEFDELIQNNDKYAAMHAHAFCLPSHDFDYNEDVVGAADVSARLHSKQNNNYKYFIALVNKFDALMGCGRIQEAYSTAMRVFRLNEEKYFIGVDEILQLCYANLLQTTGRVMEALSYYERGIATAKKIHKWDYLYGSIWRELAIAKFGDCSCLKRLETYISSAMEAEYNYLASLGNCFYVMSVYMLNIDVGNNPELQAKLGNAFNAVLSNGYQGHIAQVEAATYLRAWGRYLGLSLEYEEIMSSLSECQGVKGCPEVINTFIDLRKEEKVQQWQEKYLSGLIQYKQAFYDDKLSGLPTEPLLCRPHCETCEAKCCCNGAYLEKEEVELIEKFVADHQEYFQDLRQDFIIQETEDGTEPRKKTATKDKTPTEESKSTGDIKSIGGNEAAKNLTKHCNKTRCIFCSENNLCSLQVVATELQMHPWAVKPKACWSFPIQGVRDGKIIPPLSDKTDSKDARAEFASYFSGLPCGETQTHGESWRDIYLNEIEYYLYLIKNGKTEE